MKNQVEGGRRPILGSGSWLRERLLGERRRRPFYTISHTYHTHTFKSNFQPWLPYSYLQIQLSATPTILIPSDSTISPTYHTCTFRFNYQPYLPYSYLPIQLSAIHTIFIASKLNCNNKYLHQSVRTIIESKPIKIPSCLRIHKSSTATFVWFMKKELNRIIHSMSESKSNICTYKNQF